jgi:cystathionine beta-lyase/cystathionine gamma-synthase
MDISYIANILGEERENYFNAVAPPIIQTSNFAFKTIEDLRQALKDESTCSLYTRGINPTIEILRKKVAALDEAEDSLIFSSGVSAVFMAVFPNVKSGDHIVSVAKPYSWTTHLFNDLLPRFNVTCTMIDGTKIENFEKAIQPNTKIIFLESPNTLTFELQDLEAVAKLAKSKDIITVIDNTYCSPLYQKPIKMGIDLVMQTATKYAGGHSDTVAGILCGSKEMIHKIFMSDYLNVGAIISPFNAWLLLRSIRTLDIRLQKIFKTTKEVVAAIDKHPKISRIIFPFHPSFPQYELAKRQMKDAGGLFTLVLNADKLEQVEKLCESLKRFLVAVSWGGHESLVFPVCSGIARDEFDPNNENHRMVRIYIGLEDSEVLINDILQALNSI